MYRVIALTTLAAVAAAQSTELQSNDGSINMETREGETALEPGAAALLYPQRPSEPGTSSPPFSHAYDSDSCRSCRGRPFEHGENDVWRGRGWRFWFAAPVPASVPYELRSQSCRKTNAQTVSDV